MIKAKTVLRGTDIEGLMINRPRFGLWFNEYCSDILEQGDDVVSLCLNELLDCFEIQEVEAPANKEETINGISEGGKR